MTQPEEKFVLLKNIILPKDYIPDPSKLNEMIESIKSQGLFHPLIIKDNGEVIAGRLRASACKLLGTSPIKCIVYPSDKEEDDYLEISLHENLKRGNLQWYDIVTKEKELHDLRLRQAGVEEAKRGKKSAWGMRETAAELKISLGHLAEDLKLADAIMLDPSLRRIQDKQTAKRVIDENIKRTHQELGANRPVSNIETNVCHLGDSGVILKSFPSCIFDACLTDPPWLEFKDVSLTRDKFTLPVFWEVYRVLKANSFLYMFVSTQDFEYYFNELPKIGFSVQKYPLIWVKEGVLTYGRRSWEYQRDYEPILVAVKGSPALTSGLLSSVISCKVVPSVKMIHPNEKPVGVWRRLLDHCSYDRSVILDPFAGSGSSLSACKDTNRRFVGMEKEPKYFMKIQERLK